MIFGASGDLTKRKLIPALFRLAFERRLPAGFAIVGTSRTRNERRRVPRQDARIDQRISRRLALPRRAVERLLEGHLLRRRQHR
ncbi:MAG: hypothetical protein WDN31_11145 [Hyphomicrobium sp.]